MAHIMIEDSSPEAKKLLAYIRTLPYVTVIDAKKKGLGDVYKRQAQGST